MIEHMFEKPRRASAAPSASITGPRPSLHRWRRATTQLALLDLSELLLDTVTADDTNHGEVFTRRWVVDLILDLVGYTADRDLADLRALEPACGHGAFLLPMVQRLVASCEA